MVKMSRVIGHLLKQNVNKTIKAEMGKRHPFNRNCSRQGKLEEAYIYILIILQIFLYILRIGLKTLDHMVIDLKQTSVASSNPVRRPSTKCHLLSLYQLADRK